MFRICVKREGQHLISYRIFFLFLHIIILSFFPFLFFFAESHYCLCQTENGAVIWGPSWLGWGAQCETSAVTAIFLSHSQPGCVLTCFQDDKVNTQMSQINHSILILEITVSVFCIVIILVSFGLLLSISYICCATGGPNLAEESSKIKVKGDYSAVTVTFTQF